MGCLLIPEPRFAVFLDFRNIRFEAVPEHIARREEAVAYGLELFKSLLPVRVNLALCFLFAGPVEVAKEEGVLVVRTEDFRDLLPLRGSRVSHQLHFLELAKRVLHDSLRAPVHLHGAVGIPNKLIDFFPRRHVIFRMRLSSWNTR